MIFYPIWNKDAFHLPFFKCAPARHDTIGSRKTFLWNGETSGIQQALELDRLSELNKCDVIVEIVLRVPRMFDDSFNLKEVSRCSVRHWNIAFTAFGLEQSHLFCNGLRLWRWRSVMLEQSNCNSCRIEAIDAVTCCLFEIKVFNILKRENSRRGNSQRLTEIIDKGFFVLIKTYWSVECWYDNVIRHKVY